MATAGHTVSTALSEDWAVHGFAICTTGDTSKGIEFRIEDTTIGILAGNNSKAMTPKNSGDQFGLALIGHTTAVADTTVFDIDIVCREEFDVVPEPNITDAWISGFTYELAAATAGLPGFHGARRGIARGVARGIG